MNISRKNSKKKSKKNSKRKESKKISKRNSKRKELKKKESKRNSKKKESKNIKQKGGGLSEDIIELNKESLDKINTIIEEWNNKKYNKINILTDITSESIQLLLDKLETIDIFCSFIETNDAAYIKLYEDNLKMFYHSLYLCFFYYFEQRKKLLDKYTNNIDVKTLDLNKNDIINKIKKILIQQYSFGQTRICSKNIKETFTKKEFNLDTIPEENFMNFEILEDYLKKNLI